LLRRHAGKIITTESRGGIPRAPPGALRAGELRLTKGTAVELLREEARLATLAGLNIADAEPDAAFDRYTRLAQKLLNAPVAAISVIDRDTIWYKSRVGFATPSRPRTGAMCEIVTREMRTLVAPDLARDARFRDMPFVAGAPFLRFYAGAPIIVRERHAVGALCVMDQRARELTAEDVAAIECLARGVADEIEAAQTRRDSDLALSERESLLLCLLALRAGELVADTELVALGFGLFAPAVSATRLRAEMETLRLKLAALSSDAEIVARGRGGYRVDPGKFAAAAARFPRLLLRGVA
jgi:GAF domain-containing protein